MVADDPRVDLAYADERRHVPDGEPADDRAGQAVPRLCACAASGEREESERRAREGRAQ